MRFFSIGGHPEFRFTAFFRNLLVIFQSNIDNNPCLDPNKMQRLYTTQEC